MTETINVAARNDAPEIATWYNPAWSHRKEILINATQVDGDLTEFPVLINLGSDAELAALAQNDGDDLLFTAADGSTQLAHEIEGFDGATGALTAWVKSDLSGSNDTRIYLYYGNGTVGNQEDPENVWDASFQGV